ncbi:MAG: hypothetical protein EA399_16190 [Desulfovibrionales bacterium]|nr:MAG: hypothetical protein EA399_16190 [Desulfovibrionales bacterium]
MSRTALDGFPLQDTEKDFLMATVAKLCKIYFVDLLGFCLMGNHFHLVVRMNPAGDLTDAQIAERYKLLYGKEARIIPARSTSFVRNGDRFLIDIACASVNSSSTSQPPLPRRTKWPASLASPATISRPFTTSCPEPPWTASRSKTPRRELGTVKLLTTSSSSDNHPSHHPQLNLVLHHGGKPWLEHPECSDQTSPPSTM